MDAADMAKGRRRDIGLGGIQLVSLAEAREKTSVLRRIARAGGDPIFEKRARPVEAIGRDPV